MVRTEVTSNSDAGQAPSHGCAGRWADPDSLAISRFFGLWALSSFFFAFCRSKLIGEPTRARLVQPDPDGGGFWSLATYTLTAGRAI